MKRMGMAVALVVVTTMVAAFVLVIIKLINGGLLQTLISKIFENTLVVKSVSEISTNKNVPVVSVTIMTDLLQGKRKEKFYVKAQI